MMTEHVKRFLSMLVEALLGQATRLARLGRRAPRGRKLLAGLRRGRLAGSQRQAKQNSRNSCEPSLSKPSGRRFRPPLRRSGRWT